MSNHHYVKTLPEYFTAVANDIKPFEVRRNDRNYQVGDTLHLQEYSNGIYTGREITKQISYILNDPAFCKNGFVVMGLTANHKQHETNKRIEEMAKALTEYEYKLCERLPKDKCLLTSAIHAQVSCDYCKIAEFLVNVGYRKQSEGEWVKVMNHRECSNCGYNAPYKKIKAGYHLQDLTKHCPNCGAKMKGDNDEQAD